MVIDVRSYQTEAAEVDAQNAREQARIREQRAAEQARIEEENAKNQKQLQRWIEGFNSQPPFTSFCGIAFGLRLTGDLERTENGRYLRGEVELDTPFRGCDRATVYASVKSRRIFRIEIETKDHPSNLGVQYRWGVASSLEVLDKKYNPYGNPLINVNTYLAMFKERAENRDLHSKDLRYLDTESKRVKRIVGGKYRLNSDYNLNGGYVRIVPKKVGTGSFYHDVEEIGPGRRYAIAVPKEHQEEVGVLIATSYKYEKIANKEYEEESGGDGSGVL